LKLKNMSEVAKRPLYICVYGVPNMGKTSLVKTLPGRTLVIDAESGLAPIADFAGAKSFSVVEDDNGVVLSDSGRLARLEQVMTWLATPEARAQFDNVVLDSLSEVGRFVLAGCEKMVEDKAKAENKKADTFAKWNVYAAQMHKLVNYFRDLGAYTTVFLALEDRIDDEETGTSQYWPALGGKQARTYLPRVFDCMLRLVADADGQRRLVTKLTAKTQAKIRVTEAVAATIEPLEPAHLGNLIAKIKGEKK
jgi:phage nucleotide-binding protein